ncbi:MAG TPA: FAD-dependent oxidoreductase [Actinomycetota bacterium]|nr:FAD-dependent oxidoreductase [Actinomycetota bacterium]
MTTFVVVGAGVAGGTAAAKLREEGFDGNVVLIGAEDVAPYERPPLSKEYLRGETSEPLYIRDRGFYEENGIDARFGVRAEHVNITDRVIELEGGERVAFDQAVVATGARNRRPPIEGLDLENVFDLRYLPDSDAIREAAKNDSKAVMVGMGFIGAEVAASLRQLGLDVTVVEFFGTPLERVLGPTIGGAIESLHRDHGVEMIFRDGAERFEGDGRFEAMVTKEGRRIEGDFAVVGVGVEPVTDVATDGLTVDNGIPVDATLKTEAEGVWAIGDVARHDHPVFGPIRVEHFDNGMKMGEHVAKNLLGANAVFDDAHWFWSDQYDAEIQMSGFATEWDDMVVRGSIEDRSFSAFLLKDGQLLSTFSMNRKFDVRRSMPLIATKAHPERAKLEDPEFDLRELHPPKE